VNQKCNAKYRFESISFSRHDTFVSRFHRCAPLVYFPRKKKKKKNPSKFNISPIDKNHPRVRRLRPKTQQRRVVASLHSREIEIGGMASRSYQYSVIVRQHSGLPGHPSAAFARPSLANKDSFPRSEPVEKREEEERCARRICRPSCIALHLAACSRSDLVWVFTRSIRPDRSKPVLRRHGFEAASTRLLM